MKIQFFEWTKLIPHFVDFNYTNSCFIKIIALLHYIIFMSVYLQNEAYHLVKSLDFLRCKYFNSLFETNFLNLKIFNFQFWFLRKILAIKYSNQLLKTSSWKNQFIFTGCIGKIKCLLKIYWNPRLISIIIIIIVDHLRIFELW